MCFHFIYTVYVNIYKLNSCSVSIKILQMMAAIFLKTRRGRGLFLRKGKGRSAEVLSQKVD